MVSFSSDAAYPAHQPLEGYLPAENARLFFRTVGRGQPVIVLHGGPDFDHTYLLPELERLGEACRLIYYDQRGRGRSAEGVEPEDATIRSDVEDLERVREHFGLETVALLGHSWGGVLVSEYAIRHPERVSHLIVLNTAPASRADFESIRAPFLGHFSDVYEWEPYDNTVTLIDDMRQTGLAVEFHTYPGQPHWFMETDRPEYDPEAAELAWERTIAFMRTTIAGG